MSDIDTLRAEYLSARTDVRLLIDILDAFIEATGESLDDGDRDVFRAVRRAQNERETKTLADLASLAGEGR